MSAVLKRVRSAFNRKSRKNSSPFLKTDAPTGLAASFFQTKENDDDDDGDDDDQGHVVSNKKPYISPGTLKRDIPMRSPTPSEKSVNEPIKIVPTAPSNVPQAVRLTPTVSSPPLVKNEEAKTNLLTASEIAKTPVKENRIEFSQENTFPFAISPNSKLVTFPRTRPPTSTRFDLMLRQMRLNPSILSSFQLASGIRSRVEIDFPTKEVLVDPSLPTSVAFKVNEAIERDRFGRAYKSYRYAYQPTNQRVSFAHYPSTDSRPDHGIRFIREITPTSVNSNPSSTIIPIQLPTISNIPMIVPMESSNTCYSYPMPVAHYTAWASADDPMRIYR